MAGFESSTPSRRFEQELRDASDVAKVYDIADTAVIEAPGLRETLDSLTVEQRAVVVQGLAFAAALGFNTAEGASDIAHLYINDEDDDSDGQVYRFGVPVNDSDDRRLTEAVERIRRDTHVSGEDLTRRIGER